MKNIHFWNGNKSLTRQKFELSLLQLCLDATAAEYTSGKVLVDYTDRPSASDETGVFEQGTDVLVTVAGNCKFTNIPKHVIAKPLMRGLLGYRLLLVRETALEQFRQIKTAGELQKLTLGVPATWADAELFRRNHYLVYEQGSLVSLLAQLKRGTCDYISLGVNEVEDILQQIASPLDGIKIEPNLMLVYPFPLVFYVNINQPELAMRIEKGVNLIMQNGVHQALFESHYSDLIERLDLRNRRIFTLKNHVLTEAMKNITPKLFD